MEPEVISTLKPSFSEYEAVGKELQDVNRRIEQIQGAMKLSRQNGAFQALQNQMKQVKELVKEKERLDAKMATMDLARKNDDDYRTIMRQETSYSERIDSVRERINELEQMMLEYSEQEDSFDFARCQRADGSFYGTRGKCRKGLEAGPAPKREGTGERGGREAAEAARAKGKKGKALITARVEGKKKAIQESRTRGGRKNAEGNARTRLFKEEVSKIRDQLKGKKPEEIEEMLRGAMSRAQERASKGEGRVTSGSKRKTTSELNQQAVEASRRMKEANRARKQAEANFKKVEKETKGDNSPEARRRRIEAGREWNKASNAADRAEKQWMILSDKASRSRSRDERKKMSPERRRQERELDKVIKERG